MNILEYIDSLMDEGYTEDQAYVCADLMFSEDPDYETIMDPFISEY